MYTSTFSDWFCQAVIDFMLGNRTTSVFSEFLLKLKATDPRDLIRLSKIRAEAIATSVSRVLSEGERLLAGWTVFAPEDLNVKTGLKFEEKILLLVSYHGRVGEYLLLSYFHIIVCKGHLHHCKSSIRDFFRSFLDVYGFYRVTIIPWRR